MRFLDLLVVRNQLNLASDEGDDTLLTSYATAAELVVESHLQSPLVIVDPDDGTDYIVVDDAIKIAMMLLVGNFYLNREAVTTMDVKETPLAYRMIINTKVNLSMSGI